MITFKGFHRFKIKHLHQTVNAGEFDAIELELENVVIHLDLSVHWVVVNVNLGLESEDNADHLREILRMRINPAMRMSGVALHITIRKVTFFLV